MMGVAAVSHIRRALNNSSPRVLPRAGRQVAAVAIVLRDSSQGAQVLLIQRAQHPLDPWSGHVAFPGGRQDPNDADDRATALRECREETGLDLSLQAQPLGCLSEIQASARGRVLPMIIVPFVFALIQGTPVPQNQEVTDVFWASLRPMLSGEAAATHSVWLGGREVTYPAFAVQRRLVWGLTHQMLTDLLELSFPGTTRQPSSSLAKERPLP